MQLADLDVNKLYSYADYYKWKFEERVELIKGKIFNMSPAPGSVHQRLSSRIQGALFVYLDGKQCEVFAAPFDVRLPRKSKEDKDILTVLQPDVCVICDPSKVDDKGCIGAPDIVVEILSPSNNKKELKYKFDVYQEAGVSEYWVVDPREKSVQIFVHSGAGLSSSGFLFSEDQIVSSLLPGFSLPVEKLFENT
jgi:Uma2 family endonuclease